jgi:hypothetical protein
MSRHPQWEARLAAFVEKNRQRPYEPSRFDCLLMPAEAVKAVTGKDHGRGHRGNYKSTAGAYRYLQSLGFKSPEAYLDSLFPEKPVGFAQRGDLVLASDGIPALCMGGFALSVGEGSAGLVRVEREDWVKAWAAGADSNVG